MGHFSMKITRSPGHFSAAINIEGVDETGKPTGFAHVALPNEDCPHIVTEIL